MNTRKTLLSASILAALLTVASGAWAADGAAAAGSGQQQSSADQAANKTKSKAKKKSQQLEGVVVTGIRGSVEQSLDIKRDASSVVEVITAEDVGKLPAHNVADTLQRLPGVNISSSSADEGGFDEADRVSLRGTSPSLTQTLIDGHTVGSADWFVLSQFSNMGRSVSYSLLPSELVSRVVIHKSSEARFQDGGTTGNVDIITRKPLDFGKQLSGQLSIGGVYANLPNKTDPQMSGLFNYRNADSTFGVLVQAFKQKRHLRREAQEIPGGFAVIGADSAAAQSNPDLAGVSVPGLLGATLFEQVRDRKGGLIEVQAKPTEDLTLGVSAFLSDMQANNYNRNFMLWGGSFATKQAPDPGYTIENGVLTNATYTGVPGTNYAVYDMIYREASAKSRYYTLDAKWTPTTNLEVSAQLGTTKGVGTTPRQYIAEVTLADGGGASWTTHGNSAPIDWSVGGDTSPTGVTGFGTWGNQLVKAIDKEHFGKVDFTQYFNAGSVTSLNYGVRYAKHERQATSPEGASPGDIWSALQNGAIGYYPGGFGGGIGGDFPTDIWYFTPQALKDAITANSTWLHDNDGPTGRHNYGAEFAVREKNLAGYFQMNFSTGRWSGNIGLRYVHVKQLIDTYRATSDKVDNDVMSLFGQWNRVHVENTISQLLPSANLKFDAGNNLVVRLAASQTMTLPDYSALGQSSSGSDLNKKGAGGNPNLKPVISTNFDAGIEWYFMPRGLLSASVYKMDMNNYVAYGTETQMLFSELTHKLEPYEISMPINADASVTGLELAYQQPLGEYFGFNANYTYADGSSAHTWADGSNHLLGTSRNTWNVGAYFENDTFGARISYTRRSSFLIGLSGAHPYYQNDFGTLAASISYAPTKWLSFSLDGLNLNDPTYKYYQSESIPTSFYENGRQVYLNAHLRF